MTSFRLRILAQTLPFLLIAPIALAQTPPGKTPTRGEATAALNQPAKPGAAQYTRQQIDQLVAPIALYPDELLSQVLMAATYPQQVVEAAQWAQDASHKDLKGDALAQALEPLPWDPSVKALVPFPQILVMMSEHIEWTEALGVAFATQQAEVMARVQALRHLAMKSGKLKQVKHLTIREEGPAVVITSAEPDRVYVPVYNPTVVYGAWPDREAPPVFLPPPQGFVAETIEPGVEISSGYAVVAPLWGWSRPDWRDERITVNRTEYTRITRDVEVGPGDSWRHSGPIVLVPPSEVSRTTTVTTTTNVPAGTVDPRRAAAVVALPQRAAAQPNLIQTRTSTTETSTTRPGQTTTTAQPSTTRPGQTTTTAQPNTAKPGQTTSGSTQPSATQPSTATSQPGTAQPGQASTKSTNAPSQATTAEPGKSQSSAAQPTTVRPEEKQAAPSSGTSAAGKTEPATNESAAGQKPQPGKTEANTGKANERSARHPEAASNPGKEEGKSSSTSPNRLKEAAPGNAAAKPSQSPAGSAEEGAKAPGASPQIGTPERSGSGKPSEAAQPRNRTPHENGGVMKPGREEPSRNPERSGSTVQPEPQHSAKQAPEHNAAQPSAASQPGAVPNAAHSAQNPAPPNAGGEHEVGHGSSNPPGAASPNAQPSAQKGQNAGGHAGRPEEKEKKEH